MKRGIIWLIVSSLLLVSLMIAACSPAVVEKPEATEEPEVVEEPKATEEPEVMEPTSDEPQYGGVLKLFYWLGRQERLDQTVHIVIPPMQNTHETLLSGDWSKGPAGGYGTNETPWEDRMEGFWYLYTGALAESWEFPKEIEGDRAELIFHIRKGVHWYLKPGSEASRLVGGREMTADDVVFSLKQSISGSRFYVYRSNPELRNAEIASPSPWTVEVAVDWDALSTGEARFGTGIFIVPPEVYEEYGDMTNWRNYVGTGPFMLTDFLPDSTMTYIRNPNYWDKDPVGPGKGNQLPYLDEVKYFMIPDRSTQLAALRTAKIDWIDSVNAEEADILGKTSHELIVEPEVMLGEGDFAISTKIHETPFNDIRVRRALYMAIDYEAIMRDYYGGRGRVAYYPFHRIIETTDAWFGPDPETGEWPSDVPESVKELYTYNPEKAKQLLAEAGYPEGFKTNIIIENTSSEIDYFSIIKNMWAKVGIDLELRPTEGAAFDRVKYAMTADQMIDYGAGSGPLYRLYSIRGDAPGENQMQIDDPVINELYGQMEAVLLSDQAAANKLVRQMLLRAAEQAYGIPGVGQLSYRAWWPWLKNYSGELYLGFNTRHFNKWVWIDQKLKKQMGY
ncbi:MAG: ABC transporter substrate-binding protein [Dehalococcoidales bacterium]|nr:ABC transporter substrate-binding protein [Dehalococcoidales bacterium]